MPFQYRPEWVIPGAGASESVLHYAGGAPDHDACVAAIRTFYQALTAGLPNDVSITFPSEVAELDDVTGTLEGIINVAAPTTVVGAAAGAWAGGVGTLIRWESGIVAFGRRQVGRTFIVPTASAQFAADGTPLTTWIATLNAAGDDLIDDLAAAGLVSLVVWSRAHGAVFGVTSTSVPDRSAILRERRDD